MVNGLPRQFGQHRVTPDDANMESLFNQFYAQWYPWLYASARRKGVTDATACDLAQDTILALFMRLGTTGVDDHESYLCGTLNNLLRMHWRKKATRKEVAIDGASEVAARQESDLGRQIMDVLDQLIHHESESVRKGVLFLLEQLDGKSLKEIAAEYAVAVGTIKSATYAARNEVRKVLS